MKILGAVACAMDIANDRIGRGAAWLALIMVLLQFTVVLMRYVFGIGSIFMQEGVIYLHGALFLVGAGYTLLHGGHVRVDIFYRDARPRRKALVDLLGTLLFLLPVCVVSGWASVPYVAQSWVNLEGSRETSGSPAVFVLKSFILLFVVLIALQGVSLLLHSILILTGAEEPEPEKPEPV